MIKPKVAKSAIKTRHNGFSLIEVLIAMLIVAVGILGVAGLQMVSLQQNRNTILRDQALQAGNDMLDRMRANPATDYAPVTLTAVPAVSKNCITSSCNPVEMAAFDITQWKCRINPFDGDGVLLDVCDGYGIIIASLPEGSGAITKAGEVHTVMVQWVRDRKGNISDIKLRTKTGVIQ